jgi:hypothetical protein
MLQAASSRGTASVTLEFGLARPAGWWVYKDSNLGPAD